MNSSTEISWSGTEQPDRRTVLRIGGLGLFGLALPHLLCGRARAAARQSRPRSFGQAKSCVLIFLKGGPSQIDTFDMKPAAPLEIRGQFRPIATSVPGIQVCEHLPFLAQQAQRFTVLRSLCHQDNNHASAAYEMSTGHVYPRSVNLSGIGTREDHPHIGAAAAAVEGKRRPVPPFFMVPQYLVVNGEFRSGQNAGFLGARHDPVVPGGDPSSLDFRTVDLGLGPSVESSRLQARRNLLKTVEAQLRGMEKSLAGRTFEEHQEKAFSLLDAGLSGEALDLAREPASVRDRYGRNFFGQSLLLARRLVQAGVQLVHVNCMSSIFGGLKNWDTHKDNFKMLKDPLLPRMDQGVAAFLEDLAVRGLLDETLVIVVGEFGRTPKVNAGAGRDHWAAAFTALLAGAGLPGGRLFGATDKYGAYPVEHPVPAGRLSATIFHALGIDPALQVPTLLGRPWRISDVEPVLELWG